jgi:ABC-type nitrate/sulfonate/bicarbonate transport system substrate-binding protein
MAAHARGFRLGVFSPSVLLGVAASPGAPGRAGLSIEEVSVASSAEQFRMLVAGELDAVFTSPDNVIAYRGSSANPLGEAVDVRILAAVDRGLGLSLFRAQDSALHGPEAHGSEKHSSEKHSSEQYSPEQYSSVPSDAGLRGGVLAVDAPNTGFAFVAYELMARRGLRRGDDYAVAALGATPLRANALIAGRCAATVLNAGSDLRAEAAGCERLGRAVDLGAYVGTVLAALGGRVEREDTAAALRTLTRSVLATAHELVDGASRPTALALALARERLALDHESASRYVATLANAREGLIPDGRLDSASLDTLLRLRQRYADEDEAGTDRDAGGGPGALSGLLDERFLPPRAP